MGVGSCSFACCRLWLSNAALKPVGTDGATAEKPSQKVQDELASRKVSERLLVLPDCRVKGFERPPEVADALPMNSTRVCVTANIDGAPPLLPPRPSVRVGDAAGDWKGTSRVVSSHRLSRVERASLTRVHGLQVCDVLDYVPVAGRAVRFASTAVMNYYHQFHFYTSAS